VPSYALNCEIACVVGRIVCGKFEWQNLDENEDAHGGGSAAKTLPSHADDSANYTGYVKRLSFSNKRYFFFPSSLPDHIFCPKKCFELAEKPTETLDGGLVY